MSEETIKSNSDKRSEWLAVKNPFHQHLGLEYEGGDENGVTLSVLVKPDLENPLGYAHGGVIFSLMDCCTGFTARADGRQYVTLDANVNYLNPGPPGKKMYATSSVIRRGATTCILDVRVKGEDDKILAVGRFTMFCISPVREGDD